MSYTVLRDVCLIEGAAEERLREGCDLWLQGERIQAITDARERLPLTGAGEEIRCDDVDVEACEPELLAQMRSCHICYVPTLAAIEQLAPRFLDRRCGTPDSSPRAVCSLV
jgi:hypothetical protein